MVHQKSFTRFCVKAVTLMTVLTWFRSQRAAESFDRTKSEIESNRLTVSRLCQIFHDKNNNFDAKLIKDLWTTGYTVRSVKVLHKPLPQFEAGALPLRRHIAIARETTVHLRKIVTFCQPMNEISVIRQPIKERQIRSHLDLTQPIIGSFD